MEKETILEMLEERQYKELKLQLENMHPVDIAELMEELDEKQIILVFRLLEKDEAAETFTEMNSDLREQLLNALTDSEIEEFMEEMYLDDTVDIVEELPANVVERRVFDSCEVNKCLQTAEMRLFLCQISKKLLLYVLYAVVFYAIIEV